MNEVIGLRGKGGGGRRLTVTENSKDHGGADPLVQRIVHQHFQIIPRINHQHPPPAGVDELPLL